MSETNPSIKEWSEDDRPREKLLNKGAAALTDAELLAILINQRDKTPLCPGPCENDACKSP